jgi:hypothetical protein
MADAPLAGERVATNNLIARPRYKSLFIRRLLETMRRELRVAKRLTLAGAYFRESKYSGCCDCP